MNKKVELRYIKHQDIDSEKWNRCIDEALNCRIYAYSWHLDRTAITWDALIWGDYKFVMPLPIRKKMGIKYIYQPLFSQQLGIFPNPTIDIKNQFYSALTQNFFYSDVQINSANSPESEFQNIDFSGRNNYLLSLESEYVEIKRAYSTNTKRNIARANKNNLTLVAGMQLEEYLRFKLKNINNKLDKSNIDSLRSVIALGLKKGFGEIHGVYTTENQLCSAVYFCRWKNRIIYMNAASSEMGKELRGMYFLIDRFIQSHASSNNILDFEGSMIAGVARFFSGFGAEPEIYHQLKFNRLPLLLKWLKRK